MTRRRLPAGARVHSLTGLSLRSLRARVLRSILTAGAVVLGVGMVFGVLLLVGTIHSTFDRLFDSIYGNTDVVISGEQMVGSLPATTIDQVRAVRGVETASGSIGSVFRITRADGKADRGRDAQVFVQGVDYAQPDPTTAETVAGREPRAGRREIELSRDWADEHGLHVGETMRVSTPSGLVDLRVSGLYEFPGGLELGGYGTGAMPLDVAGPIMDKQDVWDEIAVVAADGTSPADLRSSLDLVLGEGIDVATPQARTDDVQDQLASLDVVLYFFSGIALFVGAFLILNSFNMTVLQRMREIGTLRALGATDRVVARAVLTEAALLGIAGSLGGLALGAGLAVLLLQAMESFGMPVSDIDFSITPGVVAFLTGMVATLAGATWPALRAGRISPIRALTGGSAPRQAPGRRRALVGLALFVPGMVGGGFFWFATTEQGTVTNLGAIVATIVLFLGMVQLSPFVVLPLVRLLSRPLRRVMPAEGRLAADAAQLNPGRTAATAATLLVALSVVVVNATIASSFVGSVKSELDERFARDLTVQPLGYQDWGPPQSGISRRVRTQLAALPEAGAVAGRRVVPLNELPEGGSEGLVIGYDPREYRKVDEVEYEGAPVEQVLQGLEAGGVVPAKSYAEAQNLAVGDTIRLEGASSSREVRVVGIADTFDGGGQALFMSIDTMGAVYGVRTDSQLILKAASSEQRSALEQRVEQILDRDHPALEALSNAEIKKTTTDAINQQFAFFNAIVAIAVLVGALGIVNVLTMSVLERTREIGVLRALGASRWRVRRTMANESLLISLAGTFAGMAAGLLIGVVWVLGMRETMFPGMTMHLPIGTLATIAVLGVVLGVVAAILPARRAAHLDPLSALRYE
ncbi:MAG TPA: ABC transporter permease [Baekduia sp.]|nr:ABC transporter permease [Baekduia sp.]